MDVRCERCETEYELEDGNVSESGTDVQCTMCGHTFVVARRTPLPAAAVAETDGPPAADWMLETGDGRVHRFRNLTSLQKWIIERKATREDKISRIGHGWRCLGDIVELAPFFEVVDEADRARASRLGARDLVAEAAEARQAVLRRSPPFGVPVAAPAPAPRSAPQAAPGGRGDPAAALRSPGPAAPEVETEVVARRGPGWWKGLVGASLAGLLGLAGLRVWQGQLQGGTASPLGAAAGPRFAAAAMIPGAPATGAAGAGLTTPIPAPPAAAPPPPAGGATPSAPPAVAPPAPAGGATPPAAADAPTPRVAAAPPRPALPYERLVADGDRALENGLRGKAARLYDQALEQRPDGAEAMAGVGNVMLDRGRPDLAVGYFKKALASSAHPPALFGLAEAHRALGAAGPALDHYRRYLAAAPAGDEVPAALRHIKTLEGAAGAQARTEPEQTEAETIAPTADEAAAP